DIDQLGKTEIVKHKINTGNVSSIKQHPYRMSSKYEKFIKEELNRLLQQGLIKVSYITKPDAYLLPRIADMIDALAH
ncbi:11755_t:CDS:2, partial [Scutellospora calospora]